MKDQTQNEKDFEIYIANKTKFNPKEFYISVHNKKVITINISPLHLEHSKVTNTESEMAEVLNDYFASVFTVEDTYEIQKITPAKPNLIPLNNCDFTEDAVTKALDKIKVNKNPAPDCIPPSLKRIKKSNHQTSCNTIQ